METFKTKMYSASTMKYSSNIRVTASICNKRKLHPKLICYIFSATMILLSPINAKQSRTLPVETSQIPGSLLKVSEYISQLKYLQRNQTVIEEIANLEKLLSSLQERLSLKTETVTQTHRTDIVLDSFKTILSRTVNDGLSIGGNDNSSIQCTKDVTTLIEGLVNRTNWAEQMLDSIGKPGPSLLQGRFQWVGNYYQCRGVAVPAVQGQPGSQGFRGNYVVVSLAINTQVTLVWGLCLPDSCNQGEIHSFVNRTVTFGTVTSVEIRNDVREMTAATVVSIIVIVVIGLLMAIGTAIDVISTPHLSTNQLQASSLTSPSNEEGDILNDELKPLVAKSISSERSMLVKLVLAFSLYTNVGKFLNTSQSPGSLGAVHGIRFISMSWVILGHVYFFGLSYFANPLDLLEQSQHWTFDAVANAFFSVDTFFTLSGLLTPYVTITEMRRSGWRINWGLFYFHRFWRLTPPYMLTIVLVLGLQRYLGGGALWPDVMPVDQSQCEEYWWRNLLYVNNLTPTGDLCFGHSWYLSNDMQFFLISPLMIVPFFFHKKAGLTVSLFLLTAHWVTTGILSYTDQWPANPLVQGGAGTASYVEHYYFRPWCRVGPFIVGVVAGYFLAVHRGRLPLSRSINAIGWLLSIATGLGVVYGLRGDISGHAPSSVGVAALYNALSRSAWSACICWVIASCSSGYGGPVNRLLSWAPFVSLGRLTYMAYLVHPAVCYIYYSNMDQLFYFNNFNIATSYIGVLAISNMTAFVLMLGLESPMLAMEKILLPRKKE